MAPLTPHEKKEAGIYQKDWEELKTKTLGELLEMKFSNVHGEPRKFMVEMELGRRKFVRDVMIDRVIACSSAVIALAALTVSLWSKQSPKTAPQSQASQSARIFVETNNLAKTFQLQATNK